APGWIHGCLGLHFLLNRRPLYRQLRYVLFALALLIPVFSALGFVAMARELSGSAAAAAAAWSRSRIPAAPCGCRADGRCWKRAAAFICRTPRCAAAARAARPAGC